MGIDINHKHDRKVRRTAPRSEDPYVRILAKVTAFFLPLVYVKPLDLQIFGS